MMLRVHEIRARHMMMVEVRNKWSLVLVIVQVGGLGLLVHWVAHLVYVDGHVHVYWHVHVHVGSGVVVVVVVVLEVGVLVLAVVGGVAVIVLISIASCILYISLSDPKDNIKTRRKKLSFKSLFLLKHLKITA